MIKFDFFYLITCDFLMVWMWNLVCGCLINFRNGRKILTWLTFGCRSNNQTSAISSTCGRDQIFAKSKGITLCSKMYTCEIFKVLNVELLLREIPAVVVCSRNDYPSTSYWLYPLESIPEVKQRPHGVCDHICDLACEPCATQLCSHTFSVGLILEPREG